MAAFLFLWLKAWRIWETPYDLVIALILLELSVQTGLLAYLVWLVRRSRR